VNETPDLDLLADFTAGVLDGTPEGAAVAARIAEDPRWAELHAALVRADAAVSADLAALPALTMPADVASRLDAALAAEAGDVAEAGEAAAGTPGAGGAVAGATAAGRNVVPLRRKRGWLIASGSVAAGVALLAAGAIGLQNLTGPVGGHSDSTAQSPESSRTLADAPTNQPPKGAAPGSGSETYSGLTSTGTEYRTETLADQVQKLVHTGRHAEQDATGAKATVPAALQRLAAPPAMAECLAALGTGARPVAVDFGRFDGSPAAVIVLPAESSGQVEVAVVGPGCGESGDDVRLRSSVTL
jgi:hypothetical protein